MNTLVDQLRPYPTGRVALQSIPGNKLPGYHHLVPSGQQTGQTRVHIFDSTSHQPKTFEDEGDDEYEDDFAYAKISSKNPRIDAHERAAALAL